jgi:hypothetical protein
LIWLLSFDFNFKVFFVICECWQEQRVPSRKIKFKLIFKLFPQDFFISHFFIILILDLGLFLKYLITVKEIAKVNVKNDIHVKGWS